MVLTNFENFFLSNLKRFEYLKHALTGIKFTQLPGIIDKNNEYYKFKNYDYLFELNNKSELLKYLENNEYENFLNNFHLDIMLITGGKTGSSYFKNLCISNNINIFKMTEGDWQYKILLFFGIPKYEHQYINYKDIIDFFMFKNNNLILLDIIRLPLDRSISSWFYNKYYNFVVEYDKKNLNELHYSFKTNINDDKIFDEIILSSHILQEEKYYGIFPHHFNYFVNYSINIIDNLKYVLIKFEDIGKWHEILSILLNKNIINENNYINSGEEKPWGEKYKLFKKYIKNIKIFDENVLNNQLLSYYDSDQIFNYIKKYNLNINNDLSNNNTFSYKKIENFLTIDELNEIKKTINENGGYHSESQDTNKWNRKYNKGEFYNILGNKLTKKIEELTGVNNLVFSYGFGAKYYINGKLDPHYDNWNNTISCTICINNLKNEWPIYVHKKKFINPYSWRQTILNIDEISENDIEEIKLNPGDVGIFAGRNHLHWRNNMNNETEIILLHWNIKNTMYFEKNRTEPDGIYNTYYEFLNKKCYVNNLKFINNKIFMAVKPKIGI